MRFRFAALLGVLVLSPAALAQPKAAAAADDMASFQKDLDAIFVTGGLTADQAASRAVGASPSVRRKAAELAASIAQTEQAELARVPQLNAKASYTRLSSIPAFEIPIGGMTFLIPFLVNSYDAQANLAIPLSDYLVRFPRLIAAAQLGEDAARIGERSTAIGASQDARLAYYEWVRAKLQVVIARRQLAQVQATLGQEKALLDVQRVSRADYLRIESQEAQAELTADQLAQLEQLREEQLRLLIGAGEGESLAIGEDIRGDLPVPGAAPLDQLVDHAKQRRLDLKQIDLGIKAKEQQRTAEAANEVPHLSVFGTVEDARPNPRVFPQADVFKFTWLAGVQVQWVLGDTLNGATNRKRLTAEADELRDNRESLVRGTRIELLGAQQAVQLAVRSLETTKKGLDAASEGYRVRKELLNAERATAVELVDAQTNLTRALINALNARVDLRVALAQLVHALGDDVH